MAEPEKIRHNMSITVSDDELLSIDKWRLEWRLSTRTAVMRRLIAIVTENPPKAPKRKNKVA